MVGPYATMKWLIPSPLIANSPLSWSRLVNFISEWVALLLTLAFVKVCLLLPMRYVPPTVNPTMAYFPGFVALLDSPGSPITAYPGTIFTIRTISKPNPALSCKDNLRVKKSIWSNLIIENRRKANLNGIKTCGLMIFLRTIIVAD
jgi:hypothetical protein